MLEPPDLAHDTIVAAVRAGYGIDLCALAFLPIGYDSSAWAYRVAATDGAEYFLKVRAGIINVAALLVPRFLHDRGVTETVAPIPTVNGALWAGVAEYALNLYPFIEGVTATDHGMTERQWQTYGAALRQIHAMAPPPELARALRQEAFTPEWGDAVRRVEAAVTTRTFTDPIEHELATFWRERRDDIRALLERAVALGRQLRTTDPPLVLCHADIHTWNLMIDTRDQLWIVDWDETLLTPKERDLMFIVGGIAAGLVQPHEEAWFFRGYGATEIDPLALAYYRYTWAVGDIGSFAQSVLLSADAGNITKRDAVQKLIGLFAPGGIVDLAYQADRTDW